MSNRTYDIIKTVALLVLPLGTFISTLCSIGVRPMASRSWLRFRRLTSLLAWS